MCIIHNTNADDYFVALLKRILAADPESRFTIENIKEHRWFKQDFDACMYDSFNIQ